MLDIMLDEYRVTGNVSVNYDTIKDRLVRIVDGSDEQLTETETETETESESRKTSDTCDKVIQGSELLGRGSSIVRISVEKLDELVNLVGELVINRTSIIETFKNKQANPHEHALLEQFDRITTDLQDSVMELRMLPIKEVFDRFPRMVRGLAEEIGKKVNLNIRGEDTELDRSIVNRIGEPLVHLIRNAIDHGIEFPDERRAKGKSEEGNITIAAFYEGGNVIIAVEDDGAGINAEEVLKSAIKKKLVEEKQVQKMTNREILELIFTPGFSTARKITDISGRGVGMDVVKDVVEELKGSIQVESEVGKGTNFLIRLPLTLSIIDAMMVEVGNEIYALPSEVIKENIIVRRENLHRIDKGYVISNRDEIIPLIFLDVVLGCKKKISREVQAFPVVIVDVNGIKNGLVVNRLLGQQEIVTKAFGKFIGNIPGIASATILGSGNVALILHVSSLVS
jgi:two-component system chemotaxis sensor kinase CheA